MRHRVHPRPWVVAVVVTTRAGSGVLRVVFEYADGSIRAAPTPVEGAAPALMPLDVSKRRFDMALGEHITAVSGHVAYQGSQPALMSIMFHTNRGRSPRFGVEPRGFVATPPLVSFRLDASPGHEIIGLASKSTPAYGPGGLLLASPGFNIIAHAPEPSPYHDQMYYHDQMTLVERTLPSAEDMDFLRRASLNGTDLQRPFFSLSGSQRVSPSSRRSGGSGASSDV